ncbi:hypothetical protein AB0D99_26980 [Streptomyces sp. NPDC047971]|uniref:hypothetical protein n=1 Tax=Streptomyces sp. NPDC047971 TaxID=3154499 RepID=UPI0033F31B87
MTTPTDTLSDLIAAEDVLLFVNAAVTATGQREFRSSAGEQRLSLAFLHEYVRVNYRPVYAAALALDINDHNAATIVEQLLRTADEAGGPEEKRAEGRLIAARLGRMPPQRVYRLFHALRAAKVNNRRTRAIVRGPYGGTWGRVAAVLDDSYSASGSAVKRRRPLAVALGCHFLLDALAAPGAYSAYWTSGATDPLLVRPWGPTPLGARILDALEGPAVVDRLVIVSDGWDNAPPGLAGEVLRVWRTRLDPERRTSAVHVNPVYDAAGFDVRRLAPSVPTAGIRDAEDLAALVEIAGFAEGRTGLADLLAFLDRRVELFLKEASR